MQYEFVKMLRGFQYKLPLLSADLFVHDINYSTNTDFEVPHSHPFGEIYYGLQGSAAISIGEEEHQLCEGELLYIGPALVHHCMFSPVSEYAYLLLSFTLEARPWTEGVKQEYVEDEIVLLQNLARHKVLKSKDLCGCYQEIESICEEQSHGRMGGIVKLQGYVSNFFISAIQSFSEVRNRPDFDELIGSEGIRNKAVRVADYIWRHYAEDISVKTLAEELSYSPRHVQRIISEYFGLSFFELLTQYRLGQAKVLLYHTNEPMDVIAQRSGFRDEKTMRRYFKDYFHVTPMKYRMEINGLQ